jgi:hypothetical protein
MNQRTVATRSAPRRQCEAGRRVVRGRRRRVRRLMPRRIPRRAPTSAASTRRHLAFLVAVVVMCMALSTALLPAVEGVFNQLFPALMLVLGYYFGQK